MLELQSLSTTQKSQTSQPSQPPQPSPINLVAHDILNSNSEGGGKRLDGASRKGVVEVKSSSSKNKIPSSITPIPSLEAKNPYQVALGNFEMLLDGLFNPFVVKDLSEELLVIVEDSKNIQEGIQQLLSFPMPPEIRVAIQDLLEKIGLHLKASEDITAAEQSIRKDLKRLASKPKEEKIPLWPDLVVLFQIDEIKSLKNEAIKRILDLIDRGHTEVLRKYVLQQLGDNKLSGSPYSPARSKDISSKANIINEKLEESDYGDLSTLLGEVIEQKPKTKGEDVGFLERDPRFYLNRMLELKKPSLRGTIKACAPLYATREKEKVCCGFKFTLETGTVVQIFFSQKKSTYQVTVFEKKSYKLATALQNDFLKLDDVFEVKLADDTECETLLSPGQYQINDITTQIKNTLEQKATVIELIDEKTKAPRYKLYLYRSSEGEKNGIEVHQWNSDKNEYRHVSLESQSILQFAEVNSTYCAIKIEKKDAVNIIESALDSVVKFHGETNGTKRKTFKEIEDLRQSFKLTLLQPANRQLLNALIQSIIQHHLNGIDLNLLNQNEELTDLLSQIILKQRSLMISLKPEEVLIALVREANYKSLIDNEKNILVSETMKLMNGAYPHSEKFRGKDTVLFMGPTGAGKSTAVACLTGAPMETYKNTVGDSLLRVKEGMEHSYAEIGQSLSESKTLYPEAYPVKEVENLILGDCPGLNDTRGKNYVMCANVGLDFAVQWSNHLKSIVITVPIQYLLTDRANPLIEVIETVRDRFPQLFDEENLESNARVFLLFTKGDQVEPEVFSGITKGRRFQEMLLETEGSKSPGAIARHQIWVILNQMFNNGQIDVLDAKNRAKNRRLLKNYGDSKTNIDKTQYVPAMQGRDMSIKFGNCIEMSTHTWTHLILQRYLETLPRSLSLSLEDTQEKKKHIHELGLEVANKNAQLEQLNLQQQNLEELIEKLKTADPSSLNSKLEEELQNRVAATTSDQIKILKEEIESNHRTIKNNQIRSKELKEEIENTKKEIKNLAEQIARTEEEIKNLEQGQTTEQVAHFRWSETEEINVKSGTSSSILSRAIQGVRLLNKSEYHQEERRVAKNIRGVLHFAIRIEKKFRIVPKNSDDNAEFLKTQKGGKYKARIEGEKFKLENVEAPAGGKVIVYHVSTTWDGQSLPWFKIYHSIPNDAYNESTITNKKNDLQMLISQKEQLEMRLNGGESALGKELDRKQIKEQSKRLKGENELKDISIAQLQQHLALKEIQSMLEAQQKALKAIQEEKEACNLKLSELKQQEEHLQKGIESEGRNFEMLSQQKRNLALLILSELETAQQLREFSDLVIGQSTEKESASNEMKERKGLIDACKEFIAVYDTHMEQVKIDCQKTLDLSEGEKEL